MKKFLAVVKREYVQRVRSRMFIVATVLGPLALALFTVLPAVIAGIEAGGPTRIAVVDQSGKMLDRFQQTLNRKEDTSDESAGSQKSPVETMNSNQQERMKSAGQIAKGNFQVERVALEGRSLDDVKRELSDRIRKGQLDVYVVLPPDILEEGTAEFYGRKLSKALVYLVNGQSRGVGFHSQSGSVGLTVIRRSWFQGFRLRRMISSTPLLPEH